MILDMAFTQCQFTNCYTNFVNIRDDTDYCKNVDIQLLRF